MWGQPPPAVWGANSPQPPTRIPPSVFQSKDEPGGTEKARIVMAPLWVDLWKEFSRSRKGFEFDFGFGFGFDFGFGFGLSREWSARQGGGV